jgi:hypothetical protein
VPRSRPLLISSAVAAALLANYWVLEGLLTSHYDFGRSWISDLSARSEPAGSTFIVIGVVAGLVLVLYSVLLVGTLGRRSRLLRQGTVALLIAAIATVVAAAAPLSCARALSHTCIARHDTWDTIHAIGTAGEIVATIFAFALIGQGLMVIRQRPAALLTFALGALWLALMIVLGINYLNHSVGELKGAFQRIDQIVFGFWLLVPAAVAIPRPIP